MGIIMNNEDFIKELYEIALFRINFKHQGDDYKYNAGYDNANNQFAAQLLDILKKYEH